MIVKLFRPLVIIAAVAGAASTSQLANATVFDWSYTNGAPPAGGGITASGMLDATPDGGGVYTVTSITGNRNGVTITGLATYAEDDNLVYADAADLYGVGAHVDYPGLAYSVAGGSVFNIYYDTSTLDAYACGAVGYCEIGPGVAGTSGLGPPVDSIDGMRSFTLTAVPELSSWAMMGLGFTALGFVGYRKTQRKVAFAA